MYRMHGMSQGARDGGVTHAHRCTDRFLLLQNLHFHLPWRSYAARSQELRRSEVSYFTAL